MNKQKLKNKISEFAKEESSTFNEVWHRLIMERFLARLAKSKYSSSFIFKGGYLVTKYIGVHRETRDLDFLVEKLSAERASIESIIKEISLIDLNDGFVLTLKELSDLPHDHMKYPGLRATFLVMFESMKESLDIDIGIGDDVDPVEGHFNLLSSEKKGAIFEDNVSLRMYPPEVIFAEKLETAVKRGEFNSRMKDYHDLFILIEKKALSKDDVKISIERTFIRRETSQSKLPIVFTDSQCKKIQKLWSAYIKKSKSKIPGDIKDVLKSINRFLMELL